jgi:hypothetical protein
MISGNGSTSKVSGKMVVDIREYETYGAYLNGELVGFAVLRFEYDFAEIMWMAV